MNLQQEWSKSIVSLFKALDCTQKTKVRCVIQNEQIHPELLQKYTMHLPFLQSPLGRGSWLHCPTAHMQHCGGLQHSSPTSTVVTHKLQTDYNVPNQLTYP